jgi:hypothetical protein
MVFNENIGESQDRTSKEINVPEVLRFAQDDRAWEFHIQQRFAAFPHDILDTSVVASDPDLEPYLRKSS